jgi:hypothetical protein
VPRTIKLRGFKDKGTIMAELISTLLSFVIALIISTIIIFVITKLMGETEDIKTAVIAALIGTVVYTIVYYILGTGWIAAFIAGIVWLLALQQLYSIGWIKSLIIAVLIWIVTSIIGMFLPALTGPI